MNHPFSIRVRENGSVYVEAAIVMPVLLLVTFASIFFFMCAARHFSLQMLANDIARDVSLELQPGPSDPATGCAAFRPASEGAKLADGSQTIQLENLKSHRFATTRSWGECATKRYLLAFQGMDVTLLPFQVRAWYDDPTNGTQNSVVSPGDFVQVDVTYPLTSVLGGGIAFFGLVPQNVRMRGTALGIIERPSAANP